MTKKEQRKELIDAAWYQGNLEYSLKPCQREMQSAVRAWPGFKYFIKCARRLGKTHLLCSMAVEQCLMKPGSKVRYGACTGDALQEMVLPVMESVLSKCPDALRPKWLASKKVYIFPNGSRIRLAGIDLHPDRLRGTACDLFVIDEAGFVSDLGYFIDSIAMPQFLDPNNKVVAGRKLVLASSPAKTPAHEFTEMCNEAETNGNYKWFDIYSGGYPDAILEEFAKECGGKESTTWKREYLALDVVDEEHAIIPEWKKEYEYEPPRDEYFPFYLKHESLDIGVRDLTVCLFSYYDFRRAKLMILDEFVISGPKMTTEKLAEGIKAKEKVVYGEHSVYKRVSDIDLLLIQDLSMMHGLPFFQTDKGALEEMVNQVRIWVNSGKIVVSPKCTQLCGSLRYGVWNEKKTDFERSKSYGHFDALASLVYLVRNTDHTTNPIPRHYGMNPQDTVFLKPERDDKVETFKKAFSIERGRNVQRKIQKGRAY